MGHNQRRVLAERGLEVCDGLFEVLPFGMNQPDLVMDGSGVRGAAEFRFQQPEGFIRLPLAPDRSCGGHRADVVGITRGNRISQLFRLLSLS